MLNGFKRAKRRRRIGSKEVGRLRLGALKSAGVESEIGLQAAIQNENIVEVRRGLGDWLRLTTGGRDDSDCGALLAPDGGILRDSISEDSYIELMELDRKAECALRARRPLLTVNRTSRRNRDPGFTVNPTLEKFCGFGFTVNRDPRQIRKAPLAVNRNPP